MRLAKLIFICCIVPLLLSFSYPTLVIEEYRLLKFKENLNIENKRPTGLEVNKIIESNDSFIQYYYDFVGNDEIVDVILDEVISKDVPINLAFSMVSVESRFNPRATGYNFHKKKVKSIDRGLFQLNSKSYPNVSEEDFYDIEKNASMGIQHLKDNLVYFTSISESIMAYNAGRSAVINNEIPESTLKYTQEILSLQDELDEGFYNYVVENF